MTNTILVTALLVAVLVLNFMGLSSALKYADARAEKAKGMHVLSQVQKREDGLHNRTVLLHWAGNAAVLIALICYLVSL